jgi:TonB-dependent receptor
MNEDNMRKLKFLMKLNGSMDMPQYVKTSLLFVLALFLNLTLSAKGQIQGKVTDFATNDPLVGANVFVQGTSIGVVTDIEGHYSLSIPLEAGEYTIECSYIGFLAESKVIILEDGDNKTIDFVLIYDIISGEEIIITAQAMGQAAAINQQVNSDKIVSVVSEQKIQQLPDANAAEALGRLSGVSVTRSGGEANKIVLRGLDARYTTVTIDGVKLSPTDADSRGVDLSTISQGSLAGIELFKAVTSDMEGEALAGSVNLVTKGAPEERQLRFDSYGYYGSMDNTFNQYNFMGKYGERFINNKLGVQVNGNIEKRNRSSEKVFFREDPELSDSMPKKQYFEPKYIPETRKRYGGSFILDYKLNDKGFLKFNAGFSRTERSQSELSRKYPVNGDVTYFFRAKDINTDILNASLQGENYLGGWQFNWNASFTQSTSEKPYDYQMDFVERSDINRVSGVKYVDDSIRRFSPHPYETLMQFAINNFEEALFDRAEKRTENNIDNEKTIFVDAKKDYTLFGLSGSFKMGTKYRSKFHDRNNYYAFAPYYYGLSSFYQYTRLNDGSIVRKDFTGYGYEEYDGITSGFLNLASFIGDDRRGVFDKYTLYPMIDYDRAQAWHDMNINGVNPSSGLDEYQKSTEEEGKQYSLTETVTSGFLMNTLNYGTWATLITGVRLEYDNNDYNALFTTGNVGQYAQFSDTSATYSELMVLPNFHLIVRPTSFLNVRLASYKAVVRPDFNHRLPTYVADNSISGSIPFPFVFLGNPNLKNATAWNYELNLQFYGNDIGLISMSGYYKEIKDEVRYLEKVKIFDKSISDSLGITYRNDEPPFSTSYELNYPFNSDKVSKVWGFEFEHQANFRFLPGFFRNIVLDYNFSIVKTEGYYPAEAYRTDSIFNPAFGFWVKNTTPYPIEVKTGLKDSPELFGNIALGYDVNGFSIRLSYFFQERYFTKYTSDRRTDIFMERYGRLDLSIKQKISKNILVGFNVNNLNNIEEREYVRNQLKGWEYPRSRFGYGTSADLWLRLML